MKNLNTTSIFKNITSNKNSIQSKNKSKHSLLKIFSLFLSISIISNSITIEAKTLPTSFDISNASESIISYDWSMGDQGYRLYLVDKDNKVVSNKLDIIYGNPSVYGDVITNLSNSTKLSFAYIENYLDEPTYSIPFALGFAVDSNGQKSLQGYTINNKSLIMNWLLGGDEKPYYVVSNADTDKDGKPDGDFSTISEAINSTVDPLIPVGNPTILIQSTDKDYVDIVNVQQPVCLVGLTKTGEKPILRNSNGNDIEKCHYEYCPLMIASGFVKDLDIIEVESQQKFYTTACTIKSDEEANTIATDSDGNAILDEDGNTIKIHDVNKQPASGITYAVHVENEYSKDKYLEFDNCSLISNGNNTLGMGTRKGLKFNMKNCSLIATVESTGTPIFIHDSTQVDLSSSGNDWLTDWMGEYSCTFENCVFESKKSDNIDITLRNYTDVTFQGITKQSNNNGKYNFINCKLVEPRDTRKFNIRLEGHTFNYDDADNLTVETSSIKWVRNLNFTTDENYTNWGLLNKRGLTLYNGEITHETFSESLLSNNTYGSLARINKVSNKMSNSIDSEQGYSRLNNLLNLKLNGKYFFENISSGAKTGSDNNEDGENDNVTDMMEINNYTLVVEPIIWIQPANYVNGKYRNVSKNIIYGTFKEVAMYLGENDSVHINDKSSNVYSVLVALSKVTS